MGVLIVRFEVSTAHGQPRGMAVNLTRDGCVLRGRAGSSARRSGVPKRSDSRRVVVVFDPFLVHPSTAVHISNSEHGRRKAAWIKAFSESVHTSTSHRAQARACACAHVRVSHPKFLLLL